MHTKVNLDAGTLTERKKKKNQKWKWTLTCVRRSKRQNYSTFYHCLIFKKKEREKVGEICRWMNQFELVFFSCFMSFRFLIWCIYLFIWCLISGLFHCGGTTGICFCVAWTTFQRMPEKLLDSLFSLNSFHYFIFWYSTSPATEFLWEKKWLKTEWIKWNIGIFKYSKHFTV